MPRITADQVLMRDNARRLFAGRAPIAHARAAEMAWPDLDRTLWMEICAAGWPALLLPEEGDGFGLGASDLVALLEGTGDLVMPEPIGPAMVAASLLHSCGTETARALLGPMVEGGPIVLIASSESFVLDGSPTHCLADAHWADHVIAGEGQDEDFRLVAIRGADLDAAWPLRRTIDNGSARFFAVPDMPLVELARGSAAARALEQAVALLRLSAAASLIGLAQHALDMTVGYLKIRRQFGTPIGTFQALQHRAASMHVGCVAARALAAEAARAVGGPLERRAAAMAKAMASEVAAAVTKECIQMHGAIGYTEECDLSLYARRMLTLGVSYGSAAACRDEL